MKKYLFACVSLFALMALVSSCKKDTEVNKDTFKIKNEHIEAGTQSVTITGTYDYAGTIDAITLELGRQPDLMDGDLYRTSMDDTNFSVEVKNLRTNTTYYYRYVVDYGAKEPYRTEIKTFSTLEYNLPEVASKEVLSVGVNRAEVNGEVLGDGGGDAVTLRGICWSTHHDPSVGDEYANAGEGIGEFSCELTNLQPEKTYYARAFAGNSKGVSYGAELTFVTLAAGSLAEVRTVGILGNAMLQATVAGEVVSEGTSPVLERGVCYGKDHYPTTNGLHVSSGMGAGEYSCQLTNLEANAKYYVRAYAINSMGISYGEELEFVAMTETTVPTVETGMVSDITASTATGRGKVLSDGGASVTRRGLCWSTEHEPMVEGTHADCGMGVGDFSGLMPHLTDMTTYYVRAYAENSVGMAYGEEVSFTVGQHVFTVPPTVTTSQMTSIGTTTAVGGGNVTNDGGAEVTERGICWNTTGNPTIEDNPIPNGTGQGAYTIMLTGLTPNTTYYVKAYAKNSAGLIGYGGEVNFTTAPIPTYTITVSAEPSEGGSVHVGSPSGPTTDTFTENENCTVFAIENSGYVFTNWTENGTVVSSNASYTFTVNANHNLVANFTYVPQTYFVNVSANPSEGGTAHVGSPTGSTIGTFEDGTSCTVYAMPNANYTFTNWTENGTVVSDNAVYSFDVIRNRYLVANFTASDPIDVTTFFESFEGVSGNVLPGDWTTIDADGDGNDWYTLNWIEVGWDENIAHGGDTWATSASYTSYALTPDNYLVSPQVTLGGTLTFWACAQDASWAAEHFGMAISTAGNTSASDFTTIAEWTMTAKSLGAMTRDTRDGGNRAGPWYQYTVDLSAYAGQTGYVAIRHFNCSDMFRLNIDDIEVTNSRK